MWWWWGKDWWWWCGFSLISLFFVLISWICCFWLSLCYLDFNFFVVVWVLISLFWVLISFLWFYFLFFIFSWAICFGFWFVSCCDSNLKSPNGSNPFNRWLMPLSWPELSIGCGSIFHSPDSIGSGVGQPQTQFDPTCGHPFLWWFSFLKYFFLMCVLNLNQASSVFLSDPNRSGDVFSWSWLCNGAWKEVPSLSSPCPI